VEEAPLHRAEARQGLEALEQGLGEGGTDAIEGVLHRSGCCSALYFRGRCNLKQSLPAKVWRKSEGVLVLHHKLEDVRAYLVNLEQQRTERQTQRNKPYYFYAPPKPDLVLRRVLLYPGLPNAFV